MTIRTGDARRAARFGAALALALALASRAGATSLFDGDPVDPATGRPMVLQPGTPRIHPGPDEKYGTADDVFDPAIVGDVDLVLRSGGVFGGGTFPPPASAPAVAPVAVAGGSSAGGSEVTFDLVASDGAASPAGGNPLSTSELDGRGALVMAFADLDGDGVIGPHASDGTEDDQVERQEVLTPAGRVIGVFVGGAAHGGLGISLGAPASSGGLGVVLVGGAATGASPPLFLDGPWVSTLLPFMLSEDPDRILGGNSAPPDPDFLADVELELDSGRHFVPQGDHPVLGAALAIPLDGSSVTVDLARIESGAPAAIALAAPVENDAYVVRPDHRLVAGVGPGGERTVLDAGDLQLADDGPGNPRFVHAFVADLLGNATDPSSPMTFTVEAGPSLEIVAPDDDGDRSTETLVVTSAEAVELTIDDAGNAGDALPFDRLTALVDGVPTASLRVDLGGGGSSTAWTGSHTVLRRKDPSNARLSVSARFDRDPDLLDLEHAEVSVALVDDAGSTIFERTLAPGSLEGNAKGTSFRYRDDPAASPRLRMLSVKRKASRPNEHRVRLQADGLAVTALGAEVPAVTQTVRVGTSVIRSTLACASKPGGATLVCRAP